MARTASGPASTLLFAQHWPPGATLRKFFAASRPQGYSNMRWVSCSRVFEFASAPLQAIADNAKTPWFEGRVSERAPLLTPFRRWKSAYLARLLAHQVIASATRPIGRRATA